MQNQVFLIFFIRKIFVIFTVEHHNWRQRRNIPYDYSALFACHHYTFIGADVESADVVRVPMKNYLFVTALNDGQIARNVDERVMFVAFDA